MTPRPPFRYPEDRRDDIRRAVRLEWWTLFFLLTIVVAMYFTLGGSQAMRSAWIEDLLGFVPAIAFLVSERVARKAPTRRFPFGFHRAESVGYLVAATALVMVGLFLLYEGTMALLRAEHPSIGLVSVLGYEFWFGWAMIAALAYSIAPPVILGRMKKPLGRRLHNRVLLADAAMQSADWMTAAAAIVGIIGVGFGLWWADAAASLLIALDVLNDGRRHIWSAVKRLIDQGAEEEEKAARAALAALPWVEHAEFRLREEGPLVTGEIRIAARALLDDPAARLAEARDAVARSSWRLHDPVVTLLA